MSELRTDPLSGRHSLVSPVRLRRPDEFSKSAGPFSNADCPFCPGNEAETLGEVLALPDESGAGRAWGLRVVPNRYPAVGRPPSGSEPPESDADALAPIARGFHEVVIETPEHNARMSEYDPGHLARLLGVMRDRARDLERRDGVRHVQIFRNCGGEAGASLRHPHTQVISLPVAPPRFLAEVARLDTQADGIAGCPLCAMILAESAEGSRVIAARDGFVAFAPFASLLAYEVWIAPTEHAPAFTLLPDRALAPLAELLSATLRATDRAVRRPPFNLSIQTAPGPLAGEYPGFHWRIEILPRVSRLGGFEFATGMHMNSVSPERAASELRAALS